MHFVQNVFFFFKNKSIVRSSLIYGALLPSETTEKMEEHVTNMKTCIGMSFFVADAWATELCVLNE